LNEADHVAAVGEGFLCAGEDFEVSDVEAVELVEA
jgi:hypothetical protein